MQPDESGAGAPAVEVAPEDAIGRPLPSFVHGALAGVSAAAILAHVWLAVQLAPLLDMYKEMGAGDMPGLREAAFVLRARWLWGVPAVGLVALVGLLVRRTRGLAGYAVLAVLLIATAIATWHFANAPMTALAGSIQE
jgi:hypothetical protein